MYGVRIFAALLVPAILVSRPIAPSANQEPIEQDLTDQPAVVGPLVEFGHPTLLTGTPNHAVLPEEVTILKGGTVTFRVNGVGHGIAIYPVSKNTTREDIARQLCDGATAGCLATARRVIKDGDGEVVIIVEEGGQAVRIDSEPGRFLSAGSGAFLTGTTVNDAGVRLPGTLLLARFEEDGRYLVVCMNRAHLVNQWMFAFVNVTTPR